MPIGSLLAETKFFLQRSRHESPNDCELININNILNETQGPYSGLLMHSSGSRICYVDSKSKQFIESDDLIDIVGGKIYLKGRTNRSIKINGKMTDLNHLERVSFDKIQYFSCNILSVISKITFFHNLKDSA